MARWLTIAGIGIAALLLAGLSAFLLVGHVNLSGLAARGASSEFGRPVAITALHVTPGWWIRIDAGGVRVANIAGGSRPSMVELGHLSADIEALSLLRGPLLVRRLRVEHLSVLLERTADKRPNWRFGKTKTKSKRRPPPRRTEFPILLDGRVRDSAVVYRMAGGAEFRVDLNSAAIGTAGADAPVRLSIDGAYNGTPVSLSGDLQPIRVLRDASVPYGLDLRLHSKDTAFTFKGTMTEPLDLEGAKGAATLDAPTMTSLSAIAGASLPSDLSLRLAGNLEHQGDLWSLSHASGALKSNPVQIASLRFVEGSKGKPDALSAEIAFDRLDLNGLLKGGGGGGGGGSGPGIPLTVARAPDPVADLRLSAHQIAYGEVGGSDVSLTASARPGKIAASVRGLTYLGAQIKADAQVKPAGAGGELSANVVALGIDTQTLRHALGFASVPLWGKLDAQAVLQSSGATLNAAVRAADISAAISMTDGSIARGLVEKASSDLRRLFRTPSGTTAVSCLLGVLNMRAGIGTISPLRIRTGDGTIMGDASFELYQRKFDLTIAARPGSTSIFALDIPIRISGSFSDPSVRPADLTEKGRDMLARARIASGFPASLQQVVARNPCREPAGR